MSGSLHYEIELAGHTFAFHNAFGLMGERPIATTRGRENLVLLSEPDETFDLEVIADALAEDQPEVTLVVVGPEGVLHAAELTKPRGAYAIADVELALTGTLVLPALPGSLDVWHWFDDPDTSWHELSFHHRRAWLRTVMYRTFHGTTERVPVGETVELDGSVMDDYPSCFLALGEAVFGRHGYMGWNLDALADRLQERHVNKVVWNDSDEAKEMLDWAAWRREALSWAENSEELTSVRAEGESLFEAVVKVFADCDVALELK